MPKSLIELVVGDLGEKRAYRQFMKRVNALPNEYRFAFKKIQHYMYNSGFAGCNMEMFTDLVDMFEASAAEGKAVRDIIGSDVAAFCDDLLSATAVDAAASWGKLNQEIADHFHRERK